MNFTADQQRVIDLRNCNILVSAAAGSGKTAVLVERIARLVSDPENGIDIDRLLVLTFTKAAAAQMRERLSAALSQKAEEDPENEHLQRQLTLIYNAQITTIDSFCLYLIRNHFNDIGLDPDFRTADDGEMKLLAQDVLGALLEEKFSEKDPDFIHCVECFVPGGRESRLEELILQLYEFSMSYPFPEEWLKKHRSDYDVASYEEMASSEWFAGLRDAVSSALEECIRQARRTLALCEEPDGPYMYAAAIESDLEMIEGILGELERLPSAADAFPGESGRGSSDARACSGESGRGSSDAHACSGGNGHDSFAADAVSGGTERFLSGLERLYERLQVLSFARLAVKKDPSVSAEKREQAKKERERVKTMLTELRDKYFYAPPKVWLAEMQKTAPALRALVDLVLLFKEKLDEKKREKNLLDFADMEHMALQILWNRDEEGSLIPSPTAREYREQFKEILIDEYQDSNLVQEFLLQSISGEDDGRFDRFMVGDVKQSIYKFRLARPEIFMEKFDSYAKEAGDRIRVDLKQNFRSRREVTNCVNDVFCQVMHRGLGGVEYDQDAALYPAAQFPEPEDFTAPAEAQHTESEDFTALAGTQHPATAPAGAQHTESRTAPERAADADALQQAEAPDAPAPVPGMPSPYQAEFLVALDDGVESAKELEARMVADKIRALVGTLPVRDKESGGLRPASYKDIVILLRTTAGWDEDFKKVLEECGIPVYVTSKTGYFAASEVQTVLNFLRVLNNPLQDIPMFGVLHSCIGVFSDEEIARLRAADGAGKRKLYDCVKLAADADRIAESAEASLSAKCREFLDFLNRFREYAVYLPIHNLIEQLFAETGYLYTVSAMPGGGQRRANVEMLLSRAESFEQTSYSGLFHFIRYIEQMEKYNVDYGESGTLDENADVVRIMSIHKSKGLEFPICFVSGLSKRFNRQDAAQPVIMDMDLGLAADCVDPEARTKRTTLKKNVLARKLLTDSMGEELRVLYVAMTRAEEKLILTASCKAEKAPEECRTENGGTQLPALPPSRILEASSFYDILLPAWQNCGRRLQCVTAADFIKEELSQLSEEKNARQRLAFSDPKRYLDTEECRSLTEKLHQIYPHENLAELFVKTTVSELKKAGMQEPDEPGAQLFKEEEIVPYLPRFVREEEENVTGTLRGSAYHRLLELFPIEKKERTAEWTTEEVRAVIEEKQESGELQQEYAAIVSPGKIRAFLRSPLAERMRTAQTAGKLKREQPFVLGISASQLKPELPEEETVLIQGIIDAFFEEEDGLVVADYKTDRVDRADELVRRYRVQLSYYAQALERLTGKRVKEKIIYSFALEKEILLVD